MQLTSFLPPFHFCLRKTLPLIYVYIYIFALFHTQRLRCFKERAGVPWPSKCSEKRRRMCKAMERHNIRLRRRGCDRRVVLTPTDFRTSRPSAQPGDTTH